MGEELKEKLYAFLNLLVSVILDAAIVVIVAAITEIVKYIMEQWIYKEPIGEIENKSVEIIYYVSKYFLIALFSIYVLSDILSEFWKLIKKFRKK